MEQPVHYTMCYKSVEILATAIVPIKTSHKFLAVFSGELVNE